LRRSAKEEITDDEKVVIGNIAISGSTYKTVREELRKQHNGETNRPMSISVYMSKVMEEMAANIRAGKRMKKY
jgi:hypothetical protein